MKQITNTVILIFFFIGTAMLQGQDSKIIEIRKAGGSTQDEERFPGANILLKDRESRVHLYHDQALIVSHKAYIYKRSKYFKRQKCTKSKRRNACARKNARKNDWAWCCWIRI